MSCPQDDRVIAVYAHVALEFLPWSFQAAGRIRNVQNYLGVKVTGVCDPTEVQKQCATGSLRKRGGILDGGSGQGW